MDQSWKMTENEKQETSIKTPDQPDFHWSLGLKTHIQAGSSEVSSSDGAKSLTTEEKMPDVKTEPYWRVRSNTPLSMKWVEHVFFLGYANAYDRKNHIYFCDDCFLKPRKMVKQDEISCERDKERILEENLYYGKLTLAEFRSRWLSFDDADNTCHTCKARLCYIELIETE